MREPLGARERAILSWPKRILLLPLSLRLSYCEFEIPESGGTPAVRAAYIGEGLSLPYYLKLYRCCISRTREIPGWRMLSAIASARSAFPIVLVEINRALDFLLPADGLRSDSWVQQETDLNGPAYRQRKRGIERGWGQKVRSRNYRWTLSRDEKDLVHFYHEFYLPHAAHRHNDVAFTRSIGALKAAVRGGFLLQVWENQDWVSGVVANVGKGGRVSLLAAGLHPSLQGKMQGGALSAAYYFLFRWAEENGVTEVDFRGSRPNAGDGVFHHKKLWAAEPKRDPWHHTEVAFFLDRTVPLPEAIGKQLIFVDGDFVRIDEYLRAKA